MGLHLFGNRTRDNWNAVRSFSTLYGPEILLIGTPLGIFHATVTATVGVILLAAGAVGYSRRRLAVWERFLAVAGALVLVYPGWTSDVIGLVLVTYIFFMKLDEAVPREAT